MTDSFYIYIGNGTSACAEKIIRNEFRSDFLFLKTVNKYKIF